MAIDWPGLLKWSIGKHEDAPDREEGEVRRQISREDVEFLEAAVREAMGNMADPFATLQEALPMLENEDDAHVLAALAVVEKCLDFPPVPGNLEKVNGVQPLVVLLRRYIVPSHTMRDALAAKQSADSEKPEASSADEIVLKTVEILSLALAHNPPVQEAALKYGLLDVLQHLLNPSTSPPPSGSHVTEDRAAQKALTLLGSLIRNHEPAEKQFLEINGFEFLLRTMATSASMKIRLKCASLLRHFVEEKIVKQKEILRNDVAKRMKQYYAATPAEEPGDLDYNEKGAELLHSLLEHYRCQLKHSNQLEAMREIAEQRLSVLESMSPKTSDGNRGHPVDVSMDDPEPLASKTSSTSFVDDVQVERDVLKSALQLGRKPEANEAR